MNILDIRGNNNLQPNRTFTIRGTVKSIEREVKYTKIVLQVFNYYRLDGFLDEFSVHFKGAVKKLVDGVVEPHNELLVIGDIILSEGKIFFDGKIIEVYKSLDYIIENKSKFVDPKSVNYDASF